ncbi:Gfo/Idh/MocA family protein [Microbacterium tenebrionis]|uniref:Gfo/Idh/MocA family protein n=1 Tax=Microbacterium tenebrionis TaxID=2830665 RepID=UPI001D0D7A17|nr:Gfo/Idh/MocA family oxidoreductase [Microbacterium tenebrionis]
MTDAVLPSPPHSPSVGVIGAGFMGEVHSRAIRANGGRLAAIAAGSTAGSVRAARSFGFDGAEPDAIALLDRDDLDVVHICTPNDTHVDYARRAIASGIHVICEKPLATSSEDALVLRDAALEGGLVGTVPFVYRYHPMVREARARIARDGFGDVLSFDCSYLQDWLIAPELTNWRANPQRSGPSRAFADIGSHLCDLIEFVSGQRVVRLCARTRQVVEGRGGEDIAALVLELSSGAIGTVLVSQMAAGRKNALTVELHGSTASVRFEQERPDELWWGEPGGSRTLLRDPLTATAEVARYSSVPAGHAMGYQDAFNSFVRDVYSAIRGGSVDGLPTFDDGLRSVLLTEAVLRSAERGGWEDVAQELPFTAALFTQ